MIDPKLQAELRTKYNPDGSDLRKMQLRMLEMLKYIDKICRENDIKYWLSSGTCLGAVRHGGFIPWDDDVDIELLEEDYEKLITYLRNHETDEFVIQTHEDDPNYINDFAKLRDKTTKIKEVFGIESLYKHRGLFIDIFKISPSNSKSLHYLCGRLRVLEVYCKRWSIRSKIGKYIFHALRIFNNTVIDTMRPLDKIGPNTLLRHSLGNSLLLPRKASDVEEIIRIPFEEEMLPIPANYDSYLRILFGNYSELHIEHGHILV